MPRLGSKSLKQFWSYQTLPVIIMRGLNKPLLLSSRVRHPFQYLDTLLKMAPEVCTANVTNKKATQNIFLGHQILINVFLEKKNCIYFYTKQE